jgi:glycosyltransferase involved in cell wall biosynthesis
MTQPISPPKQRTISVVVPVFRGQETLASLMAEIEPLTEPNVTERGTPFCVSEVILVWDRGPDASDVVIRDLSRRYDWIRPVWLSRNYGQHPATLAGMASAGAEWIATLDEDGQHDPADIGALLDIAIAERAQLVYGLPTNEPPHGRLRNALSRLAKGFAARFLVEDLPDRFSSYRLVLGEIGRSIAAYAGPGIYLDVALGWVTADVAHCPTYARTEGRPATNYSLRRLASHFWRLVVSSGTRPLRLVSGLGMTMAMIGVLFSIYIVSQRLTNEVPIEGWTSVIVTVLLVGGAMLFSLGVIAEYIGVVLRSAIGRPLYVTVQDPLSAFPEPSDDV